MVVVHEQRRTTSGNTRTTSNSQGIIDKTKDPVDFQKPDLSRSTTLDVRKEKAGTIQCIPGTRFSLHLVMACLEQAEHVQNLRTTD